MEYYLAIKEIKYWHMIQHTWILKNWEKENKHKDNILCKMSKIGKSKKIKLVVDRSWGGENGEWLLMSIFIFRMVVENVLKLDIDVSCTTLWTY